MTFTGRCRVRLAQCALVVTALSSTTPAAPFTIPDLDARRQSFNDGWRFYKRQADGAEQPQFDDSKWRAVRLPHDWAIEVHSIARQTLTSLHCRLSVRADTQG